jgi:hypothetical protein
MIPFVKNSTSIYWLARYASAVLIRPVPCLPCLCLLFESLSAIGIFDPVGASSWIKLLPSRLEGTETAPVRSIDYLFVCILRQVDAVT